MYSTDKEDKLSDAMVTARMPKAKKAAGNQVLAKMGGNASQLINDVYDYLVAHGSSPCERSESNTGQLTHDRISDALASIDAMCLPRENRFATMDDDAIKRERQARRGLLEE